MDTTREKLQRGDVLTENDLILAVGENFLGAAENDTYVGGRDGVVILKK